MATHFDEEEQNKHLEDLHKQEEEELVATLAESKYSLPYIDLYRLGIDNEALRAITEKDSREMNVAPFKLFGKNILYDGDTVQDMRLPVFVGFRKVIAFAQAAVDESVFKKPGGSHERLCRKISRG